VGNLDRSRLAKELEPYIASQIRSALNAALGKAALPTLGGSGGVIGITPPAVLTSHVLATATGLGTYHSISGATAGHVLRASGATTALFAQLQHGDLGGVSANQHHNQSHAHNSADHTGLLAWATVDKTGSSLGDLATRNYAQLNSRTHVITGADHSIGGANLDVVGNNGSGLGLLTPSADVSAGVAALLRSDATGAVGLRKLTSTDTLDFDSATDRIRVMANNRIGTDNYASQVTGWGIDYLGGADFRYLYTDELHAKSFIADLEQALAGGQIISKSVAVLAEDFALPAASGVATLRVQDLPSAPNMAVFVSGDLIRLRKFSRAAGSLTIADAWGVVTAYADGSGANAGTQTWTFTRSAGALAGTATGTVNKDAIVLDYGVSDNGYYEVNAIDGAYALNSPYAQTVTWSGHPVGGLTVRTRMGNLRGLFNVTNEYGFYAGSGVTDADTYIRLSSYTNKINNLPMEWWSSGQKFMWMNSTDGVSLRVSDDLVDLYRAYSFSDVTTVFGGMWGVSVPSERSVYLWSKGTSATQLQSVEIYSRNTGGKGARTKISAQSSFTSALLTLDSDIDGSGHAYATLQADSTAMTIGDAIVAFENVLHFDIDGSLNVTGNGVFTGAVSGASGAFAGALTASDGGLGMSQSGAYGGYSIMTPDSGWARGFYFRTIAEALLGGFGGYGSTNTLSYLWIGNAYNDFAVRMYPATGNTEITGTLAVAETVNAGGAYKRGGTDGYIFVPMTPANLTDTGSTVWSGVSRAAGTYTFDVNTSANGSVPADAVAVALAATFTWTNANNATYATIQENGQPYSIVARATASAIGIDVAGVVNINSSGQFTVTIVNATSNTSLLRIVGYYI
jgi:hypothetical protein